MGLALPIYRDSEGKWYVLTDYLCSAPNNKKGYQLALGKMYRHYPHHACQNESASAHDVGNAFACYLKHFSAGERRVQKVRQMLVKFCKTFGKDAPTTITPLRVLDWCVSNGWTPYWTGAHVKLLKSVFGWLADQGIIEKNPIATIRPPRVPKGQDDRKPSCMQTQAEHDKMMAVCNKESRRILICMRETGCRPHELRRVRMQHYRPDMHAWVFESETKIRNRVIRLNKVMQEMMDEFITLKRDWLFRRPFQRDKKTRHLVSWGSSRDADKLFAGWFRHVRERARITRTDLTAYSYRHWFITSGLAAGLTCSEVAELAGTGVQQIIKTYGHLEQSHDHLKACLDKIHQ